ncbi:MAG: flagellar biosynthesis regulator FlaF [Rhodospirillaceae bacterium]|jgi:flagellar protein FlaF|nr:flagellar biosynthesis regulator FlaF [Rhodospirillaceae bacterium]MBT4226402.1 flagellar biosynthesis regulator FlaF [Verrucomicrobiota bacterium]MBT3884495.1 flagellar biosynthesis regulator FlaF [Rhodospirillaceae bacterium]MBT4119089.1 flagellar biosynthesis regulator FlaF [Rhodospirillaceae bacterium]MBT4674803.1 flagellar biosynthesis regulator FlaF [Rhodospirillaceae bacterium]
MSQDKIQAYAQTQKSSLSPREVEAMAFTKAALMLEEAKNNTDDYDSYASALKFNQLLWTIIQADIVDKENELPPQLKANILSLSIFVDKQTVKALADTKTRHIDSLIDINKNLAEGLMVKVESEMEAKPEPAPAQASSGLSV